MKLFLWLSFILNLIIIQNTLAAESKLLIPINTFSCDTPLVHSPDPEKVKMEELESDISDAFLLALGGVLSVLFIPMVGYVFTYLSKRKLKNVHEQLREGLSLPNKLNNKVITTKGLNILATIFHWLFIGMFAITIIIVIGILIAMLIFG